MFSEKKLIVEYINNKNNQVVVIKNFTVKISIECAGLPSLDNANIQIYGLSAELMKQLSFIQYKTLEAGLFSINVYWLNNNKNELIFTGNVVNAYPNFSQAPDVFLQISALTGYETSLFLDTPISVKGTFKVEDIVKDIAGKIKKSFTNNGVDISAEDAYIQGSPIQQMSDLSNNYNYKTIIDRNSIIITPNDKPTAGTLTIIDCNGGLVNGYIQNSQDGIELTTYYSSQFQLNGLIRVKNCYNEIANGDWNIKGLSHNLSSKINGEFSTLVKASYFNINQ